MAYIVGHPIKSPNDFFGRSSEVAHFFDVVAGTQTQSISILGLRRSGKTSFLKFISHPDTIARYTAKAGRTVMVYVDISTCKSPGEFYHRLIRQLLRQLKKHAGGTFRGLVPDEGAGVYDLEPIFSQFPDYRYILLLDEFDQLRSGHFDQDLLSDLRFLTNLWEHEVACVTASYWDMYQLGAYIGLSPTSPFYNIFYPTPIYLHGLEEEEVFRLIREPARSAGHSFTAAECEEIFHQAGSIPFFLQATAAHWLRRKCEQQAPDYVRTLDHLVQHLSSYFIQWWQQFSDLEKGLLRCVARGDAIDDLPFSPLEIEDTRRRLLTYGLLQNDDDFLGVNGAIFSTWLTRYGGRPTMPGALNGKKPQRNGRVREPMLPLYEYERILQSIQDVGKQFERMPATYNGKGEEDLRDHILLVLEPRFEGAATGETFNKTGKTDILIRDRGCNVFVAECKFWKGVRVYLDTIDQLLSYLTWRDSKAAVIIFVRNKEFSSVVKTVTKATPNHPNYLEFLGTKDESCLNYQFHVNGDPEREIRLSVMLFHVPR